MEQRSEDWYKARIGKITASRFKDITYGRKDTWSQTAQSYALELISERITGERSSGGRFSSAACDWGIEYEEEAIQRYEQTHGDVQRVGYVPLTTWIGGSPDGLSSDGAIIEVKCPYNTHNHLKYILYGCDEHMPQIQGYLWITGRKKCYFISYDPRMPEDLQMHVKTIMRDEEYIKELSERVQAFDTYVIELIKELHQRTV